MTDVADAPLTSPGDPSCLPVVGPLFSQHYPQAHPPERVESDTVPPPVLTSDPRMQVAEEDGLSAHSLDALDRLAHDLRMHQIELEMRNAELRRTQAELAVARAHNLDLFDRAPVGYLTVSEQGLILEANLRAADLLGQARPALTGRPLADFIHPADQQVHSVHCKRLFETGEPQAWQLCLESRSAGRVTDWVQVAATLARDDEGGERRCRATIVDITERKLAEEALRVSEHDLQVLFDTMTEGVALNEIIYDEQGEMVDYRILNVNRAFYEVADYRTELVIGSVATALYGMSAEYIRSFWRAHRDETTTMYTEMWSPLHNKCYFVATSPFVNNQFVTSFIEITERKRSEDALRESEARFRALFENSPYAVLLTTPEGCILSANPAACQMFRRPEAELCQVGRSGVLDTSDPRLSAAFAERTHTGRFTGELTFTRKDGHRFPGELSTVLFQDPQGHDRTSMVIRDLTERKRLEEALSLAAAIGDNLAEGANVVRVADGKIIHVTAQFANMFGYEAAELIGQHVSVLNAPCGESPGQVAAEIFSHLKTHKGWSGDILNRRKDGVSFWCHVNISAFDHPVHGAVWVSIHEDVSERKLAEQALVRSNDELRAMAVRLSQVEEAERRRLAVELHDRVGQNLAALNLNLNILRELLQPDGSATVALRLDDSIRLVDETMERIRDVMAGLRPAVLDDFGLGAALQWCAGPFSRRTGIRTVVEVDDAGLPRLPAQVETALFRIAQEVLTNIVKHARARTATLKLERTQSSTRLTIHDDGVGFDSCVPRNGVDAGWGLRIIRERAEAVNGHVQVESVLGKGTQISVEVR